ncbi:hypothetical protein, variant [Aphanomyces astaci]|uniref:PH domain-containing protein n=1 Tax=Aphanomyces astaci TaxID=112090 RepID=W4GUN2_APHAT|nr:hypothetical protein, variant [Aphanomyces astaci]ETV82603.1 hypothetical protein, variant [Aphanomyces astaci]|eukprot:XP_009828272.1 hypothetical protein, variant [Aphanomyces astaci]
MLEKWVEGLIVEYFSEWLEGFDKDGMRIGLFSGKICFQNLKFRKQALDKLNVPIVLKEGRLGSLNVKVPWKRLSKESVHIVLEDLYLVVGPYHDESSETQSTVDDRVRQAKQHDIRLRELLQSTANDVDGCLVSPPTSPKAASSPSSSWKQKMLNLVLDNLTFELKRIHVRYEDSSLMVSARPVSFGVSIDELKVSTTNANGHVTFMDRSTSHTPFVHKLFDVVEGYIYWDLHSSPPSTTSNAVTTIPTTTPASPSRSSCAAAAPSSKMTYLVEPMTTSIKITENHDAASHQFIPQYRVHVALPSLRMTISPSQCKDMANVVDFLVGHEVYLKRSHCRKARPRCSVHESPKRWWKYAIQSVLALEHDPHKSTWRKTIALLVLRSQYISLYMRLLPLLAADKAVPETDAQQRRILEDDPRLSAECIVFFRACAVAELDMQSHRRKQLAKSSASSKWTSMLKKPKPTTPVHSPPRTGFFSPKVTVTQPSSPTVSSSHAPAVSSPRPVPSVATPPSSPHVPLLTLDPLERQLVYESVSQQYFDPPPLKKPLQAAASPLSSSANTSSTSRAGQVLGLDVAITEIVCAVAKEPKGSSTDRKEFVRFLVTDLAWTYNQHMRLPHTTGPPNQVETSTVFQIRDMQLVDATQPTGSPLAVIFGHAKKAKTTALVVVKFHRRPAVDAALDVAIDACSLLYHKTAFDKIYKYITPDQKHSKVCVSDPTTTSSPNKAAEPSLNEAEPAASALTTPLRLTVHITDATCSIAGEVSAKTHDSCPFVVLHVTNIHVRSMDVSSQVDASVDSIDAFLLDQAHVANIWDDPSLQTSSRIVKKFKGDGSVHRDHVCWTYTVRLSSFDASVSETQVRQLMQIAAYLSRPSALSSGSGGAPQPLPTSRAVAIEIAIVVPVVSVRFVGNERLRSGLLIEGTSVATTAKCMRELTSIHFTVATFVATEAMTPTAHRRTYSFGRALIHLPSSMTLFAVLGREAPPTLRVDMSHLHLCWHYHVIQDLLALVVAPLPLPPVVPSTALFLHVRVHVGSWEFVMNPTGDTDMVVTGHDVESTVEVLENGDVLVDAAVTNVEMGTTTAHASTLSSSVAQNDAESPAITTHDKPHKRVLVTLPHTSTVRYEASGMYALQDRDGAAAFLDLIVANARVTYVHGLYMMLAGYMGTYITELFTWLYLAREGTPGKTTMDPALLRLKVQGTVDDITVCFPSSQEARDEASGRGVELVATSVRLHSSRYLDTPYEQLTVDVASVVAAPWWTDDSVSVRVQHVLQLAQNRQLITVHVPTLHAALHVRALEEVLTVVATSSMAEGGVDFSVDRPLLALGTPLLPPVVGVETTMSIGVDSFEVQTDVIPLSKASTSTRLRLDALHVTVHVTSTSHTTVDVTWQCLELADAHQLCQVRTAGRPRIELEVEPSGQKTLDVSLDGLHVVPDVKVLGEWVAFGQMLAACASAATPSKVTSTSSAPLASDPLLLHPLHFHIKIHAAQVQLHSTVEFQQRQFLVLHTGVSITFHKAIVRVEGRGIAVVLATEWPLPSSLVLPDALHLTLPNGRALCVPFQVDIDAASSALQVVLSPIDLVLSPSDLWLVYATGIKYAGAFGSSTEPLSFGASSALQDYFVSMVVSQASVTLVAPDGTNSPPTDQTGGGHLVPKIRLYGHRALFKHSCKSAATTSQSTDWSVTFTDDACDSVDEGMSVWCFNGALGVWEPWVEPWAFLLSMVQTVEDDTTIHRVCFHGSKQQQCRMNVSTSVLDCVGAIVVPFLALLDKEEESKTGLAAPTADVVAEDRSTRDDLHDARGQPSKPATACCGVFLYNDTALELEYQVNDSGDAKHVVPPHTQSALALPCQPLLVTDHTISLSWKHTWLPLHDVRLHAFSQSVVVVPAINNNKQVMPLLLDVEARHGQRTLTISSIVKVYNDCSVPIRIGCMRDGSAIVDAGMVAPLESKGLPLEMCESLHGLRLVVGPVAPTLTEPGQKVYQWSEAFAIDSGETSLVAACPLAVLDTKHCLCMPSFSTTSPQLSSTSQLCSHGKMYFKVVLEMKTGTTGLSFASVRVLAPCTMDNQSPVPLSLLVFTTKKKNSSTPTKGGGGPLLDEEIEPIQLHLVTSTVVPPHSKVHLYHASLQFKTYAAMALAPHQWSQLQSMDREIESIVALKDRQSRIHAVNWHSTTLHHQLAATVWPTYVLKDESKLHLLFDVELTAKKSLSSMLHLSNSKKYSSRDNPLSCATDALETDVIEATLEVLSEMMATTPPASDDPSKVDTTEDVYPYLLSGTSHVTIRLDPVRGMRTSTAAIHLEAISDSVQNCHRLFSDARKEWHDLGVRMTLTSRAKIVTIHPRYMVLNATPIPFLLCPTALVNKTAAAAPPPPSGDPPRTSSFSTPRQNNATDRVVGAPPAGIWTFAPNAPFTPFHWSSMADPTDYSVRTKPGESAGWKWSGKFNLHQVGETALNVINKATGEVHVVRIHIRVVLATQIWVVVSLEGEASHPLYRLVNRTSMRLQFWQQFDMDPGYVREVGAMADVWFGWDEPYATDDRTVIVSVPSESKAAAARVVVDQINDMVQTMQVGAVELYVQVYLDGLTKVLDVSDRRSTRDTLMRIAATAAPTNIRYVVDLLLPSLVLALVHGQGEVVVVTIGDSSVIGGYTPDGNEIEVKVQSVQIDNQHSKACPVLFAPSKDDGGGGDKGVSKPKENAILNAPDMAPFLHVSIVRLFYHPDIEFFKYLSVLMQPATLQLDASILFTLATMVSDWLKVVIAYFPRLFVDKPVTTCVAHKMQSEPRVYFETLQLHPLKLCVTFTQSTLPSQAEDVMAVVPGMFRILQTHLANIDNAPLHLNALHIFHSYTSLALLVSSVRQHYTSQSLRQIYSLIGSAEILGNPLGLVSNLGCGVKDFFYEPAAGMVRGPGQFVKGLTKGTESLVKNSVYGTFNAASKLTGSISTGLATLSMDKTYIQSRINRPKKDGPTNVGAGLLLGTKQLGQGILAGVSGIITQPAMGAYHNGLTGFVEGVGKGILGAAVKPTAGILDLAAQTTAGITYSAASFDKKPKLTRVRLPRMMTTADKRLTVRSILQL